MTLPMLVKVWGEYLYTAYILLIEILKHTIILEKTLAPGVVIDTCYNHSTREAETRRLL